MDGGIGAEATNDSLEQTRGSGGGGSSSELPTVNVYPQQPSTVTPAPAGNVRCATYCASSTVYVNKTSSCVPLCNSDVAFSEAQKRFVDIWIAVWSTLCVISTTFALLTSLLRTDRFVAVQ
jgi:hypothetical protein